MRLKRFLGGALAAAKFCLRAAAFCLLAAALCLFSAAFASTYVRYGPHAQIAATIETAAPVRVGLVLGTGRDNGNNTVSPYFQARMETAAKLFQSGKVQYLIVSGYRVGGGRAMRNYDEPEDMRETLIAMGVPRARIYPDDGSYRTYDSVLRAACVFGLQQVLIISQADHVARALFLAWALGLDGAGAAAAEPPGAVFDRHWRIEFFSRLRALLDIFARSHAQCDGPPVVLGRDPPG